MQTDTSKDTPELSDMYGKDSPYQFPKYTLVVACGKHSNNCDVWTHPNTVSISDNHFEINRVAWRIRIDWDIVDGKLIEKPQNISMTRCDWLSANRSYNDSQPSFKQMCAVRDACRGPLQAWLDNHSEAMIDGKIRSFQRDYLNTRSKIDKLEKELSELF